MRLQQIDFLRGLSILLVLGRHLFEIPENLTWLIRMPLLVWKAIGWMGVDFFFVISGFLVSGLLFKDPELNIKRFLLRRGFKIYPSFYLMILFTVLLVPNCNIGNILSELLFVQNYFVGLWQHTWSLAVEEHFYLLLPFLLFFLVRKNSLNKLPLIVGFIVAGCIVLRFRVLDEEFSWLTHMAPTHLRIDGLFFGVLLSYFYCFKRKALIKIVSSNELFLIVLSILIIGAVSFDFINEGWFWHTVGLSLLSFSFAIILIVFLKSKVLFNLSTILKIPVNIISKIGIYSYSIYLWHIPIKVLLMKRIVGYMEFDLGYLLVALIYILLSILGGIILSKCIEYPILKLRDRLVP